MIIHLLAKLYIIILGKNISKCIEMEGKREKAKMLLEGIIRPCTNLLLLGSLQRNDVIISLIFFVTLWILEKPLIRCLEITFGIC